MEDGNYVPGSVWYYAPNQVAPAIFAGLFLTSGIWHMWQCSKYSSWRLTGILPLCVALMIVGFTLREAGTFFIDNNGYWMASRVFLYVGLSYANLTNLLFLTYALHYAAPQHSPLHPGRSLTSFNNLTTLIMTLLCIGGPQSVVTENSSGSRIAGAGILKASLILQVVLVVGVVALGGKWLWNWRRAGGKRVMVREDAAAKPRYQVKRVLRSVFISCVLVACCAIFRVVEYFAYVSSSTAISSSSKTAPSPLFNLNISASPVVRYEWFFWVFDASVLLCNSLLWNRMHPARDLPRSDRTYIAEDGSEREDGSVIVDDRRGWARLLDPFDFRGLFAACFGEK